MSKARNLADLLDANGDVASGALDNVPPSNDASALTTGTLPVERVPYVGRRNLIINGAMQVNQRGVTSTTSAGYCVDRFYFNTSGATATFTHESAAYGSEINGEFDKYLKIVTTTGNNNCGFVYTVEDVKSLKTGTATLSFWAKGTNPGNGSFSSRVSRRPDGNEFDRPLNDETWTVTSSWQKFTFTFNVGSLSGASSETAASSIYIDFLQPPTDTTTDAWELNITGVQLEVGSVATPFEHRSYGEELALCQRYFQQSSQAGGNPYGSRYVPIFKYDSAGYWYGHQEFPVPMRTAPTMTTSLGASGTWGMWWEGTGTSSLTSGLPTCDGSRHGFHFYLNNNVSTVGYGGMTTHGDGSSSYRWEWFADAEL